MSFPLPESLRAREQVLLDEVRTGRVCVEWHELILGRGRLRVWVSDDAVRWADGVRYAVSCQLAQRIADELDAMLPTALLSDVIWTQAKHKLGPHPQPITSTLAGNRRHHATLEAELGDHSCGLVAGWKDWVLSAKCWGTGLPAANYGWHAAQPGATQWRGIKLHPAVTPGVAPVIQPLSTAHNVLHSDYSQLCRLVRRRALLDGAEVDLADVITGPDAHLISHEGKLPSARHPAVPYDAVTSSERPTDPEPKRSTTAPSMPAVTAPTPTKPGDKGPRVREWQQYLLAMGYKLPRFGADGDHGRETEVATQAWRDDHVDDPYAEIESAPPPPVAYEMIRARHFTRASRQPGDVHLVVLHSTENAVAPGVARNVARWFAGPSAPHASAHFIVGPDEVIQGLEVQHIAWAAPTANGTGIQVEQVGQAQRTDWLSPSDGLPVMQRTARLVRQLCDDWQIPARRVDADGLLAGERGITTHATVTEALWRAKAQPNLYRRAPWWRADRGAWAYSDHVDPGLKGDKRWPWEDFMRLVGEA